MPTTNQRAPAEAPPRREWALLFALGATVAATAVVLRILAAQGDLWFDEIWSVQLAASASGPLGIFTELHLDNNHWLNSLYLRFLGSDASPLAYRGLSILTGTGTVALAMTVGRRWGLRGVLTAGILFGFSAFLVHFDSEARGYGPAIFFGLASFVALERFVTHRSAAAGATFAAASALGILSQLTFAWVYAGLFSWSAVAICLRKKGNDAREKRGALPGLAAVHAAPAATLALLFWVDVRRWAIGGADAHPVGDGLSDLVRHTFGLHGPGWLVWLVGAGVGALGLAELARLLRARNPRAHFFVVAVLVGPFAFIAATNLSFFYARYLAVSVPFLLLLLVPPLIRISQRGQLGLWAWIGLLVLFIVGNGLHLQGLITQGRGQYRAALELILASADEGPVTVAAPAGTSQEPVIEFYRARVVGGDRIHIHDLEHWAQAPADRVLLQEMDENAPPPPAQVEVGGHDFVLVARFPHQGLSGWTWDLYRRIGT